MELSPTLPSGPLGFIGLGQMGSLMAARLAAWPQGLVVFDVRTEQAAALASGTEVVRVAKSVEELSAEAGLVGVMVVDDAQVREVYQAFARSARPGTALVVHSTIAPQTAEDLAAEALAAGLRFLDAPVSGGVAGAAAGRLALLVGGDRETYELCREALALVSDLAVWFGKAGAGTRAKLARNLINFVAIAAAMEAGWLAAASGLDLRKLSRVTLHSDALTGGPGAVIVRGDPAPLPADDPLRPILAHTHHLGEKDLGLALDLARSLGVRLPLAEAALEHLGSHLGVTGGAG